MEPRAPGTRRPALDNLINERGSSLLSAPYLLDARSSRALSYTELGDEVNRVGAQLLEWGVHGGDRVGLLILDPMTFSRWFLGGLAMGVWVAPLDPTVSAANLSRADERASNLDLDLVVSDRDAPAGATRNWRPLPARLTDAVDRDGAPTESTSEGGVILASSGTTGAPKVIALPIAQLLATATLVATHNQLGEKDRGLNPLPLWHVNAEVVGLLATLVAGASLVLDDRFHRTGFWKIADDYEVTWINAVPAIISRLATLQGDERAPQRVRFIRSASAPLSPALADQFEAATEVPVIQSYGMTEAASQICANPLAGLRKTGSVGVAVGVDVRVVPMAAGDELGETRVGRIEIKGPTVIRSYESAAYADRFDADGWLRTGDLGYFDDDQYLFIVGRDDDVINRGGEKIYPLEIENVLAGIDGVAAVAVIGEADDVFGQVPVAFVQPEDVQALESVTARAELVDRVRALANESFSRASKPVAVKLVEAFPAHATGKIRKGLLREGGVSVAYEERL